MTEINMASVSKALGLWAVIGWGQTPKEVSKELASVWLLALRSEQVTVQEWEWVRAFVVTESGRQFFPRPNDVLDLIRGRRRARALEMESRSEVLPDGSVAIKWFHPDEEQKALPGDRP